jgi:hypothetical protein
MMRHHLFSLQQLRQRLLELQAVEEVLELDGLLWPTSPHILPEVLGLADILI